MRRIGLHRAAISVGIIIIRGKPDSIIVDKIITLRLKEIVGDDVSTDVVDGYAIHAAVLPFVPVPNLGEGLTDRILASASGGIKKFDENDLPRKIAELHRRVGGKSARVRPCRACIQ